MLDPLLFLIYINDMHQIIENSGYVFFANDTTIFGGGFSSRPVLSSDLKKAQNWFHNKKLTIHVDKGCPLNFGSRSRFCAVFDGKATKVVDSYKYLAVFVEKKTFRSLHVEPVCKV